MVKDPPANANRRRCKRPNESIIKEINPEYSLEGLMLKLKLQYFGHLMQGSDSLEKILMLRKIGKFSSISPQLSIFLHTSQQRGSLVNLIGKNGVSFLI